MATYTDFALECIRNEALPINIAVTAAGAARDISGWRAFKLVFKTSPSQTARESDAKALLTLSSGIRAVDADTGLLEAILPSAATRALSNSKKVYYADVLGTDPDGWTWTLATGKITIYPATATARAVAFTPKSIAGLTLWLRADQGLYQTCSNNLPLAFTNPAVDDAAPVGGWKDRSGRSHHFWVWGSESAFRPIKKTAVLNGLPVVRANGTSQWMRGPLTHQLVDPETFNLFIVGSATAGGSGGIWDTWPAWFDGGGSIEVSAGAANRAGVGVLDTSPPTTISTPYTLGSYGLIEVRHNATTLGIRVNGGVEVTTASTIVELGDEEPSSPAQLFTNAGWDGQNVTTLFLAGDIAEVVAYDRDLTDADKARLRGYLLARYALPALRASVTRGTAVETQAPAGVSLIDRSGRILLGGESQTIMDENPDRTYISITNNSSGNLWIDWDREAQMGSPSMKLPPGTTVSGVEMGGITLEDVSIIGPTTGQAYAAAEVSGASSTATPARMVTHSGTTAEGGEPHPVMDAAEDRIYLYISNDSAQTIWWDWDRDAQMGAPSYALTAGQSVEIRTNVPIEDITIISAVAGAAYTAKEGFNA